MIEGEATKENLFHPNNSVCGPTEFVNDTFSCHRYVSLQMILSLILKPVRHDVKIHHNRVFPFSANDGLNSKIMTHIQYAP